MGKVKILIVEDEIIIADNIADALEELGYEILEPANTYSEAIQTIEEEQPDIAILDIQLTGRKTGVDLAEKINLDYKFPFIFLSSNSDKLTLEDVKKVEPQAYLVKPFNKGELYTSIEVALYNFAKQKEKTLDDTNLVIANALFIKQDKTFLRLNFKDILYLKSDHIYINIHLTNGKEYTVRGSLNSYAEKLSTSFFRTNRSYIANLDYLNQIQVNTIQVDEEVVPIGKKQRDILLEKLNKG